VITIDFETRSHADLKKVGAWAYSEHPTTDVICVCWGIDNEPIQEWWPGKNTIDMMPPELWCAHQEGHEIEAHNVSFEKSIWYNVLHKKYKWYLPLEENWRDTMAVACYYGLPAGLDKLARVLGFEPKDPEGNRLITKYSKLHLKTAKTEIPDDDFRKFVRYCRHDVRMEQSISDYLGDLPERELRNFLLDQEINLRGLCLDAEGISGATRIVESRSQVLTEEFRVLTGLNPTQTTKLMKWFPEQGINLDNMQADYLRELLEEGDIPQSEARRAIEIRLAINKASTKKLDKMAQQSGSDGRARFQTRYHGAVTGRNTGSGFQPLNLNRGFDRVAPDQLVRDIMYGDAVWLDLIYGDAMDAVAKASRHWIVAEEGKRIICGDFSSIEAIVLACLAGETWKIDAFRKGVKIYEYMADKIYGLPPGTVSKATHPVERHDGKTGELAFGYQGALGAWLKFDNSGRHSDERIIEICKAWRREHPNIVQFWYDLGDAAIEAVENAGSLAGARVVVNKNIAFQSIDEWLTMILPNGKRLWYWKPELRASMPQWHQPATKENCAAGTCNCQPRAQVTYMAMKTGQWKRVHTYGGKLCENACQATAREILMGALHRVVDASYHPVLTVYDEIVCEEENGFGSEEEMAALMTTGLEDWCKDWPIRVETWEGQRYKK